MDCKFASVSTTAIQNIPQTWYILDRWFIGNISSTFYSRFPFKRVQHLLQHAFNTDEPNGGSVETLFLTRVERMHSHLRLSLMNWRWFSIGCTLIDNDIRHHSGQNATTFWPLWWRISLSVRVHTTLKHFRFVFYHNIKRQRKCLFQSVTKTMTQRKSKPCLQRSRNMIGLFTKMSVPGWLLRCVTNWREQRCLDSYRQRQIRLRDYKQLW